MNRFAALGRWGARGFALAHTALVLVMLWSPPPPPPEVDIPWLDKAVHFALFAIWAIAWRLAGQRAIAVLVAAAIFGVITEIVQGMLPWPRTPDVLDVIADACGAAFALLLAHALGWIVRMRSNTGRNGRDSNPR